MQCRGQSGHVLVANSARTASNRISDRINQRGPGLEKDSSFWWVGRHDGIRNKTGEFLHQSGSFMHQED